MVFMAMTMDNMSIAIMSHCGEIFQVGIVHFAHDIPRENLSYNRLKYHASMVTYPQFYPLRQAWRSNGKLTRRYNEQEDSGNAANKLLIQ